MSTCLTIRRSPSNSFGAGIAESVNSLDSVKRQGFSSEFRHTSDATPANRWVTPPSSMKWPICMGVTTEIALLRGMPTGVGPNGIQVGIRMFEPRCETGAAGRCNLGCEASLGGRAGGCDIEFERVCRQTRSDILQALAGAACRVCQPRERRSRKPGSVIGRREWPAGAIRAAEQNARPRSALDCRTHANQSSRP
jgi:hypothetical protein